MKLVSKTLFSKPGINRKTALTALQKSPIFTEGSYIEDFTRKGNRWVASVKIAEFPPAKDEMVEDSDDIVIPEDSGDDEPKKPDHKDEDKGSKDDEILDLLHQILDAGGGGGKSDLSPLDDELGLEGGLEGLGGDLDELDEQFKAVAGKLATVVISRPDDGKSIKQAKAEIDRAGRPYGYRVAKAVREGGKLKVVASVR